MANDSDVDGDPLTAAVLAGPSNGTLGLNADGSFTYTPEGDYHGADSFTYGASDGTANSNTTTVSITVIAVNDAPVITSPAQGLETNEVEVVIGEITEGSGQVHIEGVSP